MNLQCSPAAATAAAGAAAGAAATAYFVRDPPFSTLLIYWHSKIFHLEKACAMLVDTSKVVPAWLDGEHTRLALIRCMVNHHNLIRLVGDHHPTLMTLSEQCCQYSKWSVHKQQPIAQNTRNPLYVHARIVATVVLSPGHML